MELKVNGEVRQVDGEGITIAQLLERLAIENRNLAVEHNGDFVEEESFAVTALKAGDTVEIVRFVGGG